MHKTIEMKSYKKGQIFLKTMSYKQGWREYFKS